MVGNQNCHFCFHCLRGLCEMYLIKNRHASKSTPYQHIDYYPLYSKKRQRFTVFLNNIILPSYLQNRKKIMFYGFQYTIFDLYMMLVLYLTLDKASELSIYLIESQFEHISYFDKIEYFGTYIENK